jgi:MYXO-CTERM domain-containing protein
MPVQTNTFAARAPAFPRVARRRALCLLAAAALLTAPAHAVDYTWIGQAGNGVWTSGSAYVGGVLKQNWSPSGPPSFGGDNRVLIDGDAGRDSAVQLAPFSYMPPSPYCTGINCGSWARAYELQIGAGDRLVIGGSAALGDAAYFNNGSIGLETQDLGTGARIVNNGLLRLSSSGLDAKIGVRGVVELSGSGETVLDNGYAAGDNLANYNSKQVLFGLNGYDDRLVIAAGHTLRGRGQVGYQGTLALDNHGLVQAEAGGQLQVNGLYGIPPPRTHSIVNTGTLRAAANSRLTLGGSVLNTGGTVEALDGALVDINSGITDGTLRTSGSGVIRATSSNGQSVTGNVQLDGLLHIPAQTKLVMGPAIVNDGTLRLGGTSPGLFGSANAGGVAEFHVDTTISGTGRVELSASSGNQLRGYMNVIGRTPVLTLGAGQVLQGSGSISPSGGGLFVVNHGSVVADGIAGLKLSSSNTAPGDSASGTGHFTNYGSLHVVTESSGYVAQAGGTMRVDGTHTGNVLLSGGVLNGLGTISGTVTVNGGTWAPGQSPGAMSAQNLTMNGGTLVLEIDGPDAADRDALTIWGIANFYGGQVVIDLSGWTAAGMAPGVASFADLITVYGTLRTAHPNTGAATTFSVIGLGANDRYALAWDPVNKTLGMTVTAAVPEPGTWAMWLGGLLALGAWRRRQG